MRVELHFCPTDSIQSLKFLIPIKVICFLFQKLPSSYFSGFWFIAISLVACDLTMSSILAVRKITPLSCHFFEAVSNKPRMRGGIFQWEIKHFYMIVHCVWIWDNLQLDIQLWLNGQGIRIERGPVVTAVGVFEKFVSFLEATVSSPSCTLWA